MQRNSHGWPDAAETADLDGSEEGADRFGRRRLMGSIWPHDRSGIPAQDLGEHLIALQGAEDQQLGVLRQRVICVGHRQDGRFQFFGAHFHLLVTDVSSPSLYVCGADCRAITHCSTGTDCVACPMRCQWVRGFDFRHDWLLSAVLEGAISYVGAF